MRASAFALAAPAWPQAAYSLRRQPGNESTDAVWLATACLATQNCQHANALVHSSFDSLELQYVTGSSSEEGTAT